MPNEDDVRTRAYHLWEAAGRPVGDGTEFWHAAKRQSPAAVECFPLDGTLATPPLDALIRHVVEQQSLPPEEALQLTEGQTLSLAPGWNLALGRPGEELPPTRRFVGGVDPASGPDRTVMAEVLTRSDGDTFVRRVTVLEPGDTRHPHAIITEPPELAGRLAVIEAACRADEVKFRKAMEQLKVKRAKQRKREAERRERDALINSLVPHEHRVEFMGFVDRGTASPEFLAFLESSEDCQRAVRIALEPTERAIREAVRTAGDRPSRVRDEGEQPEPRAAEASTGPIAWAWRNSLCRCGLHRWAGAAPGQWCSFCHKARA